tara:strand:- start:431 stop:664 length:234 start_codon:yes stop_codon:yes gene_type:complete
MITTTIDWGSYIHTNGTIEKMTKVTFDSLEEMLSFHESLGEFQEGVYGSTTMMYLIISTEKVPVSEYHAYLKAEEEE